MTSITYVTVAYAQIDWHDFVVVETVDFLHNESGNLPPPTTPDEVGARLIAQERFEATQDVEMEVESGEEEEESEEESEAEIEEEEVRHFPHKSFSATFFFRKTTLRKNNVF